MWPYNQLVSERIIIYRVFGNAPWFTYQLFEDNHLGLHSLRNIKDLFINYNLKFLSSYVILLWQLTVLYWENCITASMAIIKYKKFKYFAILIVFNSAAVAVSKYFWEFEFSYIWENFLRFVFRILFILIAIIYTKNFNILVLKNNHIILSICCSNYSLL